MSDKKNSSFTVAATIDAEDFRRFAHFNSFRMGKAWKAPAIFALIFTVCAAICFSAWKTREQAVLIGCVLLGVGILLPAVWYLMFVSSVNKEAKDHGLSRTKAQYFTILKDDGIKVVKDKEEAFFEWDSLYGVYRVKGCVYLYVTAYRAFLLPDHEDAEEVWSMICAHTPESKRKDLR